MKRGSPARREAVSEAHLGLLLELSARLAEGGDTAAAIEALEQVRGRRPAARSSAPRADADVRRGTVAASRRSAQYHQLREALRRELEAEPDPQTARLYRALLRGEADVGPARAGAASAGARASRGRPAESRSS